MKRRTLATAIIGAATFAIVVSILNLAGGGESDEWPKAMKDSFVESCTGVGASEAHCACSLKAAQDLYSADEMRSVEVEATKTGQMPGEYIERIKAQCP